MRFNAEQRGAAATVAAGREKSRRRDNAASALLSAKGCKPFYTQFEEDFLNVQRIEKGC